MGYVGYAFLYLLNTEILTLTQNTPLSAPTAGSLLGNFLRRVNKVTSLDEKKKYLEYSLRPLLSLPLGDMSQEEQTNLTVRFFKVRQYLNTQLNSNITELLTTPPSGRPLSCLEMSNLALLKKSLDQQHTLPIAIPATGSTVKTTIAFAQEAILGLSDPTKNPGDFRYFSIPHIIKILATFPTLSTQPEITKAITKHIERLFTAAYCKEAKQEIIAQYETINRANAFVFLQSIQKLQTTLSQTASSAFTATETQSLLKHTSSTSPPTGKPFAPNSPHFFHSSLNTDRSDAITATQSGSSSSFSVTAYVPISSSP